MVLDIGEAYIEVKSAGGRLRLRKIRSYVFDRVPWGSGFWIKFFFLFAENYIQKNKNISSRFEFQSSWRGLGPNPHTLTNEL